MKKFNGEEENSIERLHDLKQIEKYYLQYKMDEIFTRDFMQEFELIKVNRLEAICTQEEPIDYLFFLVEGNAKVVKALENGKNLLLSFYEPFSVVGDLELIRKRFADCTVQALTPCYFLALPTEKFRSALQKDIKLMNFVCEALAQKLENLSNNSSVNLLYSLENRLASYINMVAIALEEQHDIRCFNENLTQLAELLGTSYRHLLRTLNKLSQAGILDKRKEGYIICNEEQLKVLAGALYK